MKKLTALFILVIAMVVVMTACEGDLNAPHRNPTHDKLVGVGHGVVPEPHPSMLPWLEFRVWLWEHTFDKPVTDNSTGACLFLFWKQGPTPE